MVTKESSSDSDKATTVPLTTLFRYSTLIDKFLLVIATISGIAGGILFPCIIVKYGDMIDLFSSYDQSQIMDRADQEYTFNATNGNRTDVDVIRKETKTGLTYDEFKKATFIGSSTIFVMAICNFLLVICCIWLFNKVASRQIIRIKHHFMRSILQQDMSWFDSSAGCKTSASGSLTTSLISELEKIENGIGHSIGYIVMNCVSIVTMISWCFYFGWYLSSILAALTPLYVVSITLRSRSESHYSKLASKANQLIGSISKEALTMIKTVFAFNGQLVEVKRFNSSCKKISNIIIKSAIFSSLGAGSFMMLTFTVYTIAVNIGSKMIIDGGSLSAIFFIIWNISDIALLCVILMPHLRVS